MVGAGGHWGIWQKIVYCFDSFAALFAAITTGLVWQQISLFLECGIWLGLAGCDGAGRLAIRRRAWRDFGGVAFTDAGGCRPGV